ncbi:hypothetical protein PRUPE_2G056000 [Prunus persica]|uniref:Uncharacterized protein n=1 Tax=Prunus persica TaxID=3760 RepID=A0A251QBU0_PRUPE|nr:hypothetical protein PRUPE_2G056000 [Prunus persica]
MSDVSFFQQAQSQKYLERILYTWLNTIPVLLFLDFLCVHVRNREIFTHTHTHTHTHFKEDKI